MGIIYRLKHMLVRPEPAVPDVILGAVAERFAATRGMLCIKLSAAADSPYPFTASAAFVARVVAEIRAANPALAILLTDGGLRRRTIGVAAAEHGLDRIPGADFVDAEAGELEFVPNPLPIPHAFEGFWLPQCWLRADARLILTTPKIRCHHFLQQYSGGMRCLIGLLPRARYQAPGRRRAMRSLLHQRGMDATVADLYATCGRGVPTVLDARVLGRQDEHLPIPFTQSLGLVHVADDPLEADEMLVHALRQRGWLWEWPTSMQLLDAARPTGEARRWSDCPALGTSSRHPVA